MSIRWKITGLCVVAVMVTGVAILAIVGLRSVALREGMRETLKEQARAECAKIARDVYLMVRTQHDNSKAKLETDLSVASDVLRRTGEVAFAEETATWDAVNQFTKQSERVALPKMTVGGTWLGQNRSFGERTPVVDEIIDLVGDTCTIFQRMNEAGDMLRVATNVKKLDGERAVGTYIPAVNPDGTPNKVVSTVMRGETYSGRAFVVNAWYLTTYQPIFDASNKVAGVLYVGVKLENTDALRKGIMDVTVGKTGYVYVLGGTGDHRGKYIISKDGARDGESIWDAKDAEGRLFIQSIVEKATKLKEGETEFEWYPWQNEGEAAARMKVAGLTYFEPWDWVIGAGAYEDDFAEDLQRMDAVVDGVIVWSVVAGLGVIALVGGIAYVVTRRMVRPLANVTEVLQDMASGEGDLTRRIEVQSHDEVGALSEGFNTFVGKLHDLIVEVVAKTREVAGASTQIAASAEEVSSSMQSQADEVRGIASAVEQMSVSVTEVARKSADAADGAKSSGELAESGGEVVRQTIAGMNAIREAVDSSASSVQELGRRGEEIGQIIEVINDIADQTNLLALNAAIEAARAGEHGRGFAVVADEVRKLADRTTKATEEIGQSIEAIQTETSQAVERMNAGTDQVASGVERAEQAGESLSQIVTSAREVAGMIQSIAAAAEQQSSAAEEVARSVESIASGTQQANEGVSQSATAAAALSRTAEELQQLVGRFKIEISPDYSSVSARRW